MVIVVFQPGEKYTVNYTTLDQYDYGQVLRIQGLKLPKTVEVHFSAQETGGTSITRVGVTKDGVTDVLIPDSVLENGDTTQNYSIFAFVYITDATSGKTEYRAKLEVKARPKPEVPGGGDNPDIFREAVLEVRKSAEKAEEAQRQAEGWAHGREDLPERAEDNAKHYSDKASEDAKKTAEDRKEVERLVESVSGIDEQVAKVEKLSKNAQEAATQAGTSAEQAELHKQAAETAKESVENLSAQVQKNKESVDKTAQDFALNTQQALADVNNAGQTQTERVQTAGNTVVENIKTAQDTATRAVETAKTEAVKAAQTEGNKQVKTVADKGKEVLEAIPNFNAKLDTKLDKNQGAEHAGKALVVGEDGNVVPGEVQTEGVGDAADAIVNTVSGTLLNIKDSAERKNKGFEMSGKTTQDGTPTPDAPVEIMNAGRLNEDTGKYEVTVKVTGKNLLNIPDIDANTPGIIVIKCNISKDICISVQEKATVKQSIWRFLAVYKDGSKNYISDSFTLNTFSATPENPIVNIQYRGTFITSGAYTGIMVEYGTAATKYEPYKEQTLTLTSDRPLTKWDRLVEQDGQIGWLYNSSETILNGTEDWIRHSEINKETTQAFGLSISDLVYGEDAAIGQNVFTDKFRYINAAWTKDEAGQAINNGRLFINIEKTKASTIEEFKAWLKSNNVKVVYKTKQTEFVPLPKEEQEAIRVLQTYYPTTIVSNSEDMEIELSYVADTKNYTDRKIEEAVSAQTQNLANLLSLMPLSTQAAMIENDTNNILDNMEVQK